MICCLILLYLVLFYALNVLIFCYVSGFPLFGEKGNFKDISKIVFNKHAFQSKPAIQKFIKDIY